MERLPGARRGEEGFACVVRVVRVSGTIKKAEEDVVRRARREIVRAKMAVEGKGDGLLESLLGSGVRMDHRRGVTDEVGGIEDLDEDEEMEDDSD